LDELLSDVVVDILKKRNIAAMKIIKVIAAIRIKVTARKGNSCMKNVILYGGFGVTP